MLFWNDKMLFLWQAKVWIINKHDKKLCDFKYKDEFHPL